MSRTDLDTDERPEGKPALFLQRRSYRRRRLQDAARVLPLVALFFWMVPLLWTRDGAPGASSALIFLFSVWAALILGAALLSRAMGPLQSPESAEQETEATVSPAEARDRDPGGDRLP